MLEIIFGIFVIGTILGIIVGLLRGAAGVVESVVPKKLKDEIHEAFQEDKEK